MLFSDAYWKFILIIYDGNDAVLGVLGLYLPRLQYRFIE